MQSDAVRCRVTLVPWLLRSLQDASHDPWILATLGPLDLGTLVPWYPGCSGRVPRPLDPGDLLGFGFVGVTLFAIGEFRSYYFSDSFFFRGVSNGCIQWVSSMVD